MTVPKGVGAELQAAIAGAARHESYSLTFADFTNGVAPLFTLQAGETITETWAIVTAAFDGTPTPTKGSIVVTASPTPTGSAGSTVCDPHVVATKTTGNALYVPDNPDATAFSPVSAAVPLSFLIYAAGDVAAVGSTVGALTVHVIITKTA